MVTLHGAKKQSLPIFSIAIDSLDGKTRERIEVNGSKMSDLTTIRRPNMNGIKLKFEHARDKKLYLKPGDEYPIDIILGDSNFSKIKTEQIHKEKPGERILGGTTFGWVNHGSDFCISDQFMFVREVNDYEGLYSLDVLGVEDRGENDQLDVMEDFKENITRRTDGRHEVGVPWIPGSTLTSSNEEAGRKRLQNVTKKLKRNVKVKEEYEKNVQDQLKDGIIERALKRQSGDRIFYVFIPHKPS